MAVLFRIRKNGDTKYELHDYENGSVKKFDQEPLLVDRREGPGLVSLSDGVHPKQIPQAKALDFAMGAPDVDYNSVTGEIHFKDCSEERAWLKAHHRVKYRAGYGDPCPGDFASRREEYLCRLDKARASGLV